jgi:ribosomal protein S18 acetylase RimI-like enzyme
MLIREFTMEDYVQSVELWKSTPGVGLSRADERDKICAFLLRNPGLSFVAADEHDAVAGTVLAGHDGRRGFLYHLAVTPAHRGQGLGRRLAQASLDALMQQQIAKCHILVLDSNIGGQHFWSGLGWQLRDNLLIYSRDLHAHGSDDGNGSCSCSC